MPNDLYAFLVRFAEMLDHQWDYTAQQHAATRAEFVKRVRGLKPPVPPVPSVEPLREQQA